MSAWTSFWFWLTMLSIIGFIAVFITIQVVTNYDPPLWIWYLYGISLAFLVVGFILYCYESAQHWRVRGEYETWLGLRPVVEEACPLPPKKIVQYAPPPCTKQVRVSPTKKVIVYEQEMQPLPPPKPKPQPEPKPKPQPCPLVPAPATEPAFAAANTTLFTSRSSFTTN